MKKYLQTNTGFSLIELLIALFILTLSTISFGEALIHMQQSLKYNLQVSNLVIKQQNAQAMRF